MTDWNLNDPDAVRVLYDLSAWNFEQQAELSAEMADAVRNRIVDEKIR